MKRATDREEKLFLLSGQLDGFRATLFRQTMFAEFELLLHEKVERGESLTGEALSALYLDLVRTYHAGACEVDERQAVEWAVVPHFHYNFYVYQYATSIAASSLFAERILKKEPGALDKYIALLKSGSSDYPYELVKKAGVDLATPAPYQAIAARMNSIMDEIEKILAKHQAPSHG